MLSCKLLYYEPSLCMWKNPTEVSDQHTSLMLSGLLGCASSAWNTTLAFSPPSLTPHYYQLHSDVFPVGEPFLTTLPRLLHESGPEIHLRFPRTQRLPSLKLHSIQLGVYVCLSYLEIFLEGHTYLFCDPLNIIWFIYFVVVCINRLSGTKKSHLSF